MIQEFKIESENEKQLQKAMTRLNRHALKQGYSEVKIVSMSKEHEARRLVLRRDIDGEISESSYAVLVKDVVVDIPEQFLNALNSDWNVVGQIVYAEGLPEVVATSANLAEVGTAAEGFAWKCDTCKHPLKKAFAVKHKVDGKILIVGCECLKQYTGADGAAIIKMVEFISCLQFKETDSEGGTGGTVGHQYSVIDLENYLSVCHALVRMDGQYIKRWSKDAYGENVENIQCTRNRALAQFSEGTAVAGFSKINVTDEDRAAAMGLIEAWYNSEVPMRDGKPDDFVTQCKFLVERGWITIKTAGVAAYMVNGPRKPEGQNTSSYIGTVGERAVFENLRVVFTMDRENAYGKSMIIKFEDLNGNVITWFASGTHNYQKGDVVSRIKATIKNHDEFRGVKQTIITRAKAA